MTTRFIINHLWQSSCFALLAGLLAFVLRKHSPKIRYWVWLSASVKFLIPFALLVSLGSVVPRPTTHPASVAAPVFPNTLVKIVEPFSPALRATVPAQVPVNWVPILLGVPWALGFLAITLARCRSWLGVRAALRAGTPIELPIPVRTLITPGAEEPGIIGFLHPILVLPAQLLEHLNPRQLGAILTHEMCHVRRRDNFFAAVHMVVEAIFWFHPLVWWIGSRMVEERELACDEEVLRMGCEPADYVQGILKVCRFYTESPLPCISGVTGADIKKRLRAILAGGIAHELSGGKKVTLATIGLAALAAPVLIGVLNAPAIRAQDAIDWQTKAGGKMAFEKHPKFEVTSIRRHNAESGPVQLGPTPDGFRAIGLPLFAIFQWAYQFPTQRGVLRGDQIEGAPAWLFDEPYDVVAKVEQADVADWQNPEKRQTMLRAMLQAMLGERCKVVVHYRKKEAPVYELVLAKGGPKFKQAETADTAELRRKHPGGGIMRGSVTMAIPGPNSTQYYAISMSILANTMLSSLVDRPVVDKTGLTAYYDLALPSSALRRPPPPPPGASPPLDAPSPPLEGESIFAALEALGLRLHPAKGQVEMLVIDHVERPSEN